MAWFKCFSQSGGHIEPPEWDMELYNVEFSSSDPFFIYLRTVLDSYTVEFSLDTDAENYDNDNAFGFITMSEPGVEPHECTRVVEFSMNKYRMIVYILGRIYFDDSDEKHQAIGETSGASRRFDGDYRNTPLRVTFNDMGDFTLFTQDEHGFWNSICTVFPQGVPKEWEEGHEGEWEYITSYWDSFPRNELKIGEWYGGVALHQFDGKANYIKIKENKVEGE